MLLAFWFSASEAEVVYVGSYEPLRGVQMSDAYASVLEISFDMRGGLIVRQVHHWAALVFAAAVVVHLLRMFFTGAYRKPRRLNWLVGATLLLLVSSTACSATRCPTTCSRARACVSRTRITESIPFVGPWLASLMFGGEFPTTVLISRIYPVHIFLVPAIIAGLLAVHLGVLWLQRHTQYPGRGRDERTVVGTRWSRPTRCAPGLLLAAHRGAGLRRGFRPDQPAVALRSLPGLDATTASQPDWYTTWLEGGLRMFPPGTCGSAGSCCRLSSGLRSSCPASSSASSSCGRGSMRSRP